MKTALYFEDKDAQIALTPETEWEKKILKMIHAANPQLCMWGEFYGCQGGWVRHADYRSEDSGSLMIRVKS